MLNKKRIIEYLFNESQKMKIRLVINILLILFSVVFNSCKVKNTSKKGQMPRPKSGTFWKEKTTQITTFDGSEANYQITQYCRIDSIITYKGRKVLKAFYCIEEENKEFTVLMSLENLELLAFINLKSTPKDTLVFNFQLLSLPLTEYTFWSGIDRMQEASNKPIISFHSNYSVKELKDTTISINAEICKTKAYLIKATGQVENQNFSSNYIYLSPTSSFPGSCPVFLFTELMTNMQLENQQNKMIRTREIIDCKW